MKNAIQRPINGMATETLKRIHADITAVLRARESAKGNSSVGNKTLPTKP